MTSHVADDIMCQLLFSFAVFSCFSSVATRNARATQHIT